MRIMNMIILFYKICPLLDTFLAQKTIRSINKRTKCKNEQKQAKKNDKLSNLRITIRSSRSQKNSFQKKNYEDLKYLNQ